MTDPTPDGIHRYILETYPDTIVAAIEGGTFYSCDPANFPNFATVVTSDAFDDASNLSRRRCVRLNIGLSRDTFQRLVGDQEDPGLHGAQPARCRTRSTPGSTTSQS